LFRTNANNTATEFNIIRDALAQRGTPEQVNNLTQDMRAELTPTPLSLCQRSA